MTPQERTSIAELSEREKELRVKERRAWDAFVAAREEHKKAENELERANNEAMGLSMESVH